MVEGGLRGRGALHLLYAGPTGLVDDDEKEENREKKDEKRDVSVQKVTNT